ncbi:hypothetical protein NIES23_37220 [Trichormus variabilis NIES-23]|uniref:Uncharacterized protein n=1 Tax=Trichormus variabilis NIES-23 TaxID=1973479 RepID=A0A1Z4KPG8_ANAVA|nr:hypothetical protein NIES23_37220 [Trichormus variabilis NIES-23]
MADESPAYSHQPLKQFAIRFFRVVTGIYTPYILLTCVVVSQGGSNLPTIK